MDAALSLYSLLNVFFSVCPRNCLNYLVNHPTPVYLSPMSGFRSVVNRVSFIAVVFRSFPFSRSLNSQSSRVTIFGRFYLLV